MPLNLLHEGAPERHQLDSLRGRISEVIAAIRSTETAARHPDDVRADLVRRLQGQMEETNVGYGPFESLCGDGGKVTAAESWGARLTFAHLAYIIGVDRFVDAVMAQLKAKGCLGEATDAERRLRIAALGKELRELERAEEREILTLEAAGRVVLRRADARPQVLLEIWAEAAAKPHPAVNTRGSADGVAPARASAP